MVKASHSGFKGLDKRIRAAGENRSMGRHGPLTAASHNTVSKAPSTVHY